MPSAKGYIPAHGSSQVMLTWKRPKKVSWEAFASPTVLIETYASNDMSGKDLSRICLFAVIDSDKTCFSDNPPVKEVKLGSLSKSIEDNEELINEDNDSISKDPKTTLIQPMNVALVVTVVVVSWLTYRSLNGRISAGGSQQ